MSQQVNLIPEAGEHCLIVGQNGSGKTAFACWLMQHVPQAPIIIYDTKIEPKFALLPANITVTNMEEALKYKDDEKYDYIIVQPPVELMRDPKQLDDLLWMHFIHFQHCPAYIDEAYTFHSNGRAGQGLTALLTRGRSKGISTIISTQRPVLLSRFCITEAKKSYIFRLVDRLDRKRLDDVIPNYSDMKQPIKHGFYYFDHSMEAPELFAPVKLDPRLDTGYTDTGASVDADVSSVASNEANKPPSKHVWV